MRVVVDAIGVRPGSAAVVLANVLLGWTQAAPADQLVVLTDGPPQFALPPSVQVKQVVPGEASARQRIWAQSVGVRRLCRALGADALLSAVSASSFLGAACPSGTIVYDLRHELRPAQFSRRRRLARRLLYGWSFHRADALFCISERTRSDLLHGRPRLRDKAIATLLGADHATGWRPSEKVVRKPYVLAFGHFSNKNVEPVLHAWSLAAPRHPDLMLLVCGLGQSSRRSAESTVQELGIDDRVELLPWLADEQFEQIFAGATAILFPSDFEGFGLPAVEAMLLGVPVVVSDDPALVEVTAGHAAVAHDLEPTTLADALEAALSTDVATVAAAREHARAFTWARTAGQMRQALRPSRASAHDDSSDAARRLA